MEPFLFVLIVVGVALLVLGLWVILNYNRFIRLRQHIKESWSGIDVELKRRYELIPNLVETVKGYASHERGVFEEVTKLRNQAMANHGDADSQALDESKMLMGLKKLFAVAEAYPQLKSDTNFLALQREIALTEDRIAAARRFYNGNIRAMNQMCRSFPTNILARLFGFQTGTFFELESAAERVAPRVEL
ncbi:MAG: LemA family protein [Phycisphaeraceae bacterium]|nr:MAG: LemA family protein [Phycisphaeraceae bacterium]